MGATQTTAKQETVITHTLPCPIPWSDPAHWMNLASLLAPELLWEGFIHKTKELVGKMPLSHDPLRLGSAPLLRQGCCSPAGRVTCLTPHIPGGSPRRQPQPPPLQQAACPPPEKSMFYCEPVRTRVRVSKRVPDLRRRNPVQTLVPKDNQEQFAQQEARLSRGFSFQFWRHQG